MKKQKHAYLVMAHDNFGILKKQLELLDDESNDFFIHIDKRAQFDKEWLLENVKYSTVTFIPRRKVYWGDYSQTQTELDLIREAVKNSNGYQYLHLLSGVDLPIKCKRDIFDFFDNSDKIYLCWMSSKESYQKLRTKYYFPFIHTNLSVKAN